MVNSECCLWSTDEGFPTVLMSAATGCKSAKLGWNKIEHQNTFFQYFFHFYPISGIHWTLKMPHVFYHLEVYMKTWFFFTISLINGFTPFCITLMAPGKICSYFKNLVLKKCLYIYMCVCVYIYIWIWMWKKRHNFGSGNGLVPSSSAAEATLENLCKSAYSFL